MERQKNKPFARKGRKPTADLPPIQLKPLENLEHREPEEETITIHGPLWKWDWVSKLRDGLLPALVMVLLVVVPSFLIPVIQDHFSRPGLLVYMLLLLTLGVLLLEGSLHDDRPIIRRCWYGLSGGIITWMATEVTDRLSGAGLISLNAVPFFLIIGLIVAILWRRVLPLPTRWFVLVFFMNWLSRFLVGGEQFLATFLPAARLAYLFTAALGGLGAIAFLALIIWRSRERVQRMRMAVWLWFSTLLILEILFVMNF